MTKRKRPNREPSKPKTSSGYRTRRFKPRKKPRPGDERDKDEFVPDKRQRIDHSINIRKRGDSLDSVHTPEYLRVPNKYHFHVEHTSEDNKRLGQLRIRAAVENMPEGNNPGNLPKKTPPVAKRTRSKKPPLRGTLSAEQAARNKQITRSENTLAAAQEAAAAQQMQVTEVDHQDPQQTADQLSAVSVSAKPAIKATLGRNPTGISSKKAVKPQPILNATNQTVPSPSTGSTGVVHVSGQDKKAAEEAANTPAAKVAKHMEGDRQTDDGPGTVVIDVATSENETVSSPVPMDVVDTPGGLTSLPIGTDLEAGTGGPSSTSTSSLPSSTPGNTPSSLSSVVTSLRKRVNDVGTELRTHATNLIERFNTPGGNTIDVPETQQELDYAMSIVGSDSQDGDESSSKKSRTDDDDANTGDSDDEMEDAVSGSGEEQKESQSVSAESESLAESVLSVGSAASEFKQGASSTTDDSGYEPGGEDVTEEGEYWKQYDTAIDEFIIQSTSNRLQVADQTMANTDDTALQNAVNQQQGIDNQALAQNQRLQNVFSDFVAGTNVVVDLARRGMARAANTVGGAVGEVVATPRRIFRSTGQLYNRFARRYNAYAGPQIQDQEIPVDEAFVARLITTTPVFQSYIESIETPNHVNHGRGPTEVHNIPDPHVSVIGGKLVLNANSNKVENPNHTPDLNPGDEGYEPPYIEELAHNVGEGSKDASLEELREQGDRLLRAEFKKKAYAAIHGPPCEEYLGALNYGRLSLPIDKYLTHYMGSMDLSTPKACYTWNAIVLSKFGSFLYANANYVADTPVVDIEQNYESIARETMELNELYSELSRFQHGIKSKIDRQSGAGSSPGESNKLLDYFKQKQLQAGNDSASSLTTGDAPVGPIDGGPGGEGPADTYDTDMTPAVAPESGGNTPVPPSIQRQAYSGTPGSPGITRDEINTGITNRMSALNPTRPPPYVGQRTSGNPGLANSMTSEPVTPGQRQRMFMLFNPGNPIQT